MTTRRLMLFPCETGRQDGYSIAVGADVARLAPGPEDVVLFRTHQPSPPRSTPAGQIRTFGMPSAARKAWNILSGRPPFELEAERLRACLAGVDGPFEELFSGEIFFYRALRQLYPDVRIYARSHNFYSLARCRQLLGHHPTSLRHALNLALYSKLEMELLADRKVTLIFITEEELAFARLLSPRVRGECWPVIPAGLAASPNLKPPTVPRLVFFGTAASHTTLGLDILAQKIFPALRANLPGAEFHLFGHGTEPYHDPAQGIQGHGRFVGEGLPFGGDGLFVVPDVHGCGIKLKVADLLKAGAPFISTPLGMSGYHLAPHPHILVEDLEDWAMALERYFRAQASS
ncbi:MAG: hypothetical protein H6P99_2320 [Holophagaceae bacterium]|nr:hypothetical protein [Holophagaceae bacterium]